MSSRRTTLFVAGFGQDLRAKDLAYEFERFGRLVRCDIPAPKSQGAKVGYAFVEFEDDRDAEDAYHDMHGRRVDGYQLTVQWAKNAPSSNWRYEARGGGGGGPGPRGGDDRERGGYGGGRRRSPPPRRGGGGSDFRGGRGGDERDGGRARSRSPPRRGGRSPSPAGRRSPLPSSGAGGADGPAGGAEADDAAPASRFRDEGSPSNANGARRDERSLSPRD